MMSNDPMVTQCVRLIRVSNAKKRFVTAAPIAALALREVTRALH